MCQALGLAPQELDVVQSLRAHSFISSGNEDEFGSGSPSASSPLSDCWWRHLPCGMMAGTALDAMLLDNCAFQASVGFSALVLL